MNETANGKGNTKQTDMLYVHYGPTKNRNKKSWPVLVLGNGCLSFW